jgi:3-oxoacyl-[acyl-carrier protein] reductase
VRVAATGEIVDRVALVTGASRGIGRAVALALAAAGAHVAVTYRQRAEEAAAVVAAIAAGGRRAVALQVDVTDAAAIAATVAAAERALGEIDILVNNAGITRPLALEAITPADWDDLIAVNLTAAFLVTRAVVPGMRRRGHGRIVNISSVAAQLGGVVGPHYAAAKAGLHGLTHAYAALLAREGITVNTVAPALIATEMVRDNPRARADLIPVGRFGLPEEVADVVTLLAGNGYITGQTFNVNGGWYMS